MPMTGAIDRVEVITSVQRRRRWSAAGFEGLVRALERRCSGIGSAYWRSR